MLLLGLFVFAWLWPALVGGKILSPIADLYGSAPWQHGIPSDVHTYVNPTLFDLPAVDYPWRWLVRSLLHEGVLPAWDPYVFAGNPLYSNPQTGLFSPFNLPLWILPLLYALGVTAALKLLAAAVGTYLLARQLRLGFLPGLLAGIAFAFAAINITWLAHETLPGVTVMLPWTILFVERLFERARSRDALGLALATAVGLGGGHPGMQVHLLLVTSGYALVRAACTSRETPRLRPLALGGAGLAAGALLMAFMLVPELRSSHETLGVAARVNARLPGDHLRFAAIKTFVFPDWWGRPSALQPPADLTNYRFIYANFCERTFYAGAVALLLACVGLLARGAWRRKGPFAIVGAVGLAIALRVPGLHVLWTHLPVVKSVESQRLQVASALAVAVLSAFGLQALLDAPRPPRSWLAVPMLALFGGLFAFLSADTQPHDLSRTVRHFLTGVGYADKDVLAMTSIAWFLLFALGVAVLLALAWLRPRWRIGLAVGVVVLAGIDMQHFVGNFQPMGPQSKVIPPVTPAIAFLERHRDDGRIVGFNSAFPNDWPIVYRLRDVRGYDPPYPTVRMLALWRHAFREQVEWGPFSLNQLETEQLHVLSVLGARYILTAPEARSSVTATRSLRLAYAGPDALVAVNPGALPRAFVAPSVTVVADAQAAAGRIAEAEFDPRASVAVESDQPAADALAGAPRLRGSVAVVHERNAGVTLRARLPRRGLVVLDDMLVDGWTVRIDGRPAHALHVDGVLRGVVVPAGSHEIAWSYAVPGLPLGAALSALALLGIVGVACAPAIRVHRRRRDRVRGSGARRAALRMLNPW